MRNWIIKWLSKIHFTPWSRPSILDKLYIPQLVSIYRRTQWTRSLIRHTQWGACSLYKTIKILSGKSNPVLQNFSHWIRLQRLHNLSEGYRPFILLTGIKTAQHCQTVLEQICGYVLSLHLYHKSLAFKKWTWFILLPINVLSWSKTEGSRFWFQIFLIPWKKNSSTESGL